MPDPSVLDPLPLLIERWRADSGGTYQSWFLWRERLKNFRSIRRGLGVVVAEIKARSFGNAYRGSSLETVVGSVAEQRQMFRGADHAFLWKPKLRIPDIYENDANQLAFAHFLDTCAGCDEEAEVLSAIRWLDAHRIKGLGPAAANLLYFLHPTIVPPSNTAIVRGYNRLTGANVRLGKWDEYLAMRSGLLELNRRYRPLLSNDLGAIGGFLFDVGCDRYPLPSPTAGRDDAEWRAALSTVRAEAEREQRARTAASDADVTHTEVQGWLRDLGHALGFRVWVAANDRSRPLNGGRLDDGCLKSLPAAVAQGAGESTVPLIDVLWLPSDEDRIAAAFEVEHSTSIYSGIVRMLDLALGLPEHLASAYFLVAPDNRESEVRAQFARPAFNRVTDLDLSFLPYSALRDHRQAMARFGAGLKPVLAVAHSLRVRPGGLSTQNEVADAKPIG